MTNRAYFYLSVFVMVILSTGAVAQEMPVLSKAMTLLEDHMAGTVPLSNSEMDQLAGDIQDNIDELAQSPFIMEQAFDVVGRYERTVGPLFINPATKNGFPRKPAGGQKLEHVIFALQQGLIDQVFTAEKIKNSNVILEGAAFRTASYFPGAVDAPKDPAVVHEALINASQPEIWGAPIAYHEMPARRPTGCYLAPGSIAEVIVPESLVQKEFNVRVGAHSWDLVKKKSIKRLDRVSIVYPIEATRTSVANPLGGNIYIEVPYLADAGAVKVKIRNAVRSPFFSARSIDKTTLTQWQETERYHPGPWTDFESDKFMMQVPSSWVTQLDDPVSLMADWDKSMDAVSELFGHPLVHPKTLLYLQVDVTMRGGANFPGYPQSNLPYSPHKPVEGYRDHWLLKGPQYKGGHITFHELGHAMFCTKFRGEVEALVNLPYVPVLNKKFGVDLDIAYGKSFGNEHVSIDQAAIMWMVTENFRQGRPMDISNNPRNEVRYQHRGWGKYVEIANLFGWKALEDFYRSVNLDYRKGITYERNSDPTDNRILRMSKAAGVDLRPLIHFWGIQPKDNEALGQAMKEAGLESSPLIYNRLVYYQTLIPMSNKAFAKHTDTIYPKGLTRVRSPLYGEGWYQAWLPKYQQSHGQAAQEALQDILDLYFSTPPQAVFPGANESTPSLAQYFSWINNTNEGSTEEQTLINLDFFQWLHDEYGMVLDIYAFDAGNIDGPRYYGSTDTDKFKQQFPRGFQPIYEKAKAFGCRLGMWLGPDGFGSTLEEEQARIDLLVGFCRDYEFQLFKMDAVCTQLRTEKQAAFARLMTECREYSPDLILLNHRLNLGGATPHATTFLWGGAETYIDVHMANWKRTGTHNRVQALTRGTVPELKRMTEDHGVCLSSCLDFWDDDLILQAFNRSLILAPEIYANPWFLRDDEFPKLARIYNLHRRYRDIMTQGLVLPAERYGPNAVSRGDDSRRLITLRNLTWKPVRYSVQLDESIGLKGAAGVSLVQFHPTEKLLAQAEWGGTIEVEVLPFRSCLLLATTDEVSEVVLAGCDYEVVRDIPNRDVLVNVMGYPGTETKISLQATSRSFKQASLDGKNVSRLLKDKAIKVTFPGEKIKGDWHYKLGDLQTCEMPDDAEALYEATCFAADNDPLEFRSLERSGPTAIKQVQKARDAFVNQGMVHERGIDPAYLFDGDLETSYRFKITRRHTLERNLRIDFGQMIRIDRLRLILADDAKQDFAVQESTVAEVSADLKTWKPVQLAYDGQDLLISIPGNVSVRYLRTNAVPEKVKEIEGYAKKKALSRQQWRVSYLFDRFANRPAVAASSLTFTIEQHIEGSYLCIPLEGKHGVEGAYAACRMGNRAIGASSRSASYPCNPWEYPVVGRDSHYTYYIPISPEMIGKSLELVVLGLDQKNVDFKPSAWVTAYPVPMVKKKLVLVP